jgi:hypothetical protein
MKFLVIFLFGDKAIWGFPKIGVPQDHGFKYKNELILDDLGYPYFRKPPSKLSSQISDDLHPEAMNGFLRRRCIPSIPHLGQRWEEMGRCFDRIRQVPQNDFGHLQMRGWEPLLRQRNV